MRSAVKADNKKPQPKPGLVQRERRTGRSSWEAQRPAQSEVKFGFVAKVRGISANTLESCATQLPNGNRTPAGSPLLPESWWFRRRPRKPESRWRLSQYLILTRGPRAFLIWPPCSGQPAGRATTSGAPKVIESFLAEFGVARGVLDRAMTKPILNGPCVVALIGQSVAAGVAQHVDVNLEGKAGALTDPLN